MYIYIYIYMYIYMYMYMTASGQPNAGWRAHDRRARRGWKVGKFSKTLGKSLKKTCIFYELDLLGTIHVLSRLTGLHARRIIFV